MKFPEHLATGDAERLDAAGIGTEETHWYHAAGVLTVGGILAWQAVGLNGSEAFNYHFAGITTLDEAQKLHAAGISGCAACGYSVEGIKTSDAMLMLHGAGIDHGLVSAFQRAGTTTDSEMVRLAKIGWDRQAFVTVSRARQYAGDAVVDRVLAAGERLGRFPSGTLIAVVRSRALAMERRLAEDLLAASDDDLQVAVVLAEDQYASTGKVSVPFIRESIGIL